MTLVTIESVNEALDYVEQHNGHGRKREAKAMLKIVKTFGWVVNSPADAEPVETFTRSKEVAEKFRSAGWSVTEVFADTCN